MLGSFLHPVFLVDRHACLSTGRFAPYSRSRIQYGRIGCYYGKESKRTVGAYYWFIVGVGEGVGKLIASGLPGGIDTDVFPREISSASRSPIQYGRIGRYYGKESKHTV